MKIAITGGTGFVGNELTKLLVEKGHHVFILSRIKNNISNDATSIGWLSENSQPEKELEGIDAIVNLAGESINNGRWTEEQKKENL